MVSVLSAIQNDHPKVFLAMLREMFRYGQITICNAQERATTQVPASTTGSHAPEGIDPHIRLQHALVATIADSLVVGRHRFSAETQDLTRSVAVISEHIRACEIFPPDSELEHELRYDARERITAEQLLALERYGANVVHFTFAGRPVNLEFFTNTITDALNRTRLAISAIKDHLMSGEKSKRADWEKTKESLERDLFKKTALKAKLKGARRVLRTISAKVQEMKGKMSGGTITAVLQLIPRCDIMRQIPCHNSNCSVEEALTFFLDAMANSDNIKTLASGEVHGYTLCSMLSPVVLNAIARVRYTRDLRQGIGLIVEWARENPGRPILFIDPNWEGYLGIGVRWNGSGLVMCAQKVDGGVVDLFYGTFADWVSDALHDEVPYAGSFLNKLFVSPYKFPH
jgi:hypothetical protein